MRYTGRSARDSGTMGVLIRSTRGKMTIRNGGVTSIWGDQGDVDVETGDTLRSSGATLHADGLWDRISIGSEHEESR